MSKTRIMVQAAMLVAISVVLTRFLAINASIAGVHALRLSFGELPLMLAGLLFGPAVGALAGVSADLVGIALFPPPAIFPGFTLSAALTGALPPLIWRGWRIIARRDRAPRGADAREEPAARTSATGEATRAAAQGAAGGESPGDAPGAAAAQPSTRRGGSADLPLGFAGIFVVVLFTGVAVSGLNTVWLHVMYSTPYALLLPPRIVSEAILIPAHALLLQATLRTYAVAFLGARRRRSA